MRNSRLLALFVALMLALASVASLAQSGHEPTVDDIYQAASRGDLAGARTQVDQVLAKHPNSAKAHYVKAEVAARQRDLAVARTELQIAERLAPGLPFAKPQAVSALRAQLDRAAERNVVVRPVPPAPADSYRAAPAPQRSFPISWVLGLLALVVLGVIAVRRLSRAASVPPAYPAQPPAEPFGRYEPNMPPPGSYPPQAPSLGSTLGRGLATGLAVGAGVVAAEEIGHRMFGHEAQRGDTGVPSGGSAAGSSLAQDAGLGAFSGSRDTNADMGGQDFGIADNGGWDDGGGSFGVDGSDDWNS